MEKQENRKYGKVVSIRAKKETADKLEELRLYYSKYYGFELCTSDVINMIILKEYRERTSEK